MAILLLFQNADTLSYAELQENTKLNDDQLVKQAQSLIECKLLLTENVSNENIMSTCMSNTMKLLK